MKLASVWWHPGEPEDNLHGFVTKQDRDDFEAGKPGPFLRVVRHPNAGPIPLEVQLIRQLYGRNP